MRVRKPSAAIILLATVMAFAQPASAAVPASAIDSCYFIVTMPSPTAPAKLTAGLKKQIAVCADAMEYDVRAAIRLGRKPTASEKAWQSAIIKQFVKNGCVDTSVADSSVKPCQVFPEQWPYGYAGRIAKPGTIIVFGFEGI